MKRAVSKIKRWETDRADRQKQASTFVARFQCVSTNQLFTKVDLDLLMRARGLSSVKVVVLDFKSGTCAAP